MNWHGVLGDNVDTIRRPPSLYIFDKTRIHFGFGTGQEWIKSDTNSVLTLNAWNHIAATFDGRYYKIYANGSEVFSVDRQGKVPYATPVEYIGRTENRFKGKVCEVRFWDRARTAAELQAHMNHRLTGTEAGLKGYWPLNEGSGMTATDRSGNGHNGALKGNPTWVADGPASSGAPGGTTSVSSTTALKFDGAGSYISLPPACMPAGNEITVSFWAKGGRTCPARTALFIPSRPTRTKKLQRPSPLGVGHHLL